MKSNVKRADQSPMNEQRWLCVLDCGHEQWVTARRRPAAVRCDLCARKVEVDHGEPKPIRSGPRKARTCGWHIAGDLHNRCPEAPVRGKAGLRAGANLCPRHLAEYDRRWGPNHEHEWDGKWPDGQERVL